MSVFLRWGIFGILGVAALMYAYNASKRMAEKHAQQAPAATQPAEAAVPQIEKSRSPPEQKGAASAPLREPPPSAPVPAHCEAELRVAQRAIDARKAGEPLDRLLRIQEIAFEESPPRRERLEKVATRYFNYEGEFQPAALRIAVLSDCAQATP